MNRRNFLKGVGVGILGSFLPQISTNQVYQAAGSPISRSPSSDLPNVLLIVMDTVRAQNMSMYGYSRETTPFLKSFANEGLLFERAISTAPWTLPSHASMFTGRWHHELSADWGVPLDNTHPTLAEVLTSHGYSTAGFVANISNCSKEHGVQRGFGFYDDYGEDPFEIVASTSFLRNLLQREVVKKITGEHRIYVPRTAADINRSLIKWLDATKPPFFAFLNYFDAHMPYHPPKPYTHFYPGAADRVNGYVTPQEQWTSDQIHSEIDAYDGAIAYLDSQIHRLMEYLEYSGNLKNTIVIVTSDHGEQLGEHELFDHTNSLYIQALHVPLLIIPPRLVGSGQKIQHPVSLRDLPSTILEMLGVPKSLPGRSMLPMMSKDSSPGKWEFPILSELNQGNVRHPLEPIAAGNMKSLILGEYHYILEGDGSEELYRWTRDPEELENLANQPSGIDVLERMKSALRELLQGQFTNE